MREAVCRLFLSVYSNGCSVGGDLRERTGFLAPYGLQGDMVDFPKVSASVAQRLLKGENLILGTSETFCPLTYATEWSGSLPIGNGGGPR